MKTGFARLRTLFAYLLCLLVLLCLPAAPVFAQGSASDLIAPSESTIAPSTPNEAESTIAPSTPNETVTTTASGLQYIDIEVGTGPSPETGQTVKVHYTGTLEDGTEFDSSVRRNRPFEFIIGIGQVIKGWDEGVMSMKVGGKRQLTIPPDLGYGSRGAGGVIPPNATLKFDVELLDIS